MCDSKFVCFSWTKFCITINPVSPSIFGMEDKGSGSGEGWRRVRPYYGRGVDLGFIGYRGKIRLRWKRDFALSRRKTNAPRRHGGRKDNGPTESLWTQRTRCLLSREGTPEFSSHRSDSPKLSFDLTTEVHSNGRSQTSRKQTKSDPFLPNCRSTVYPRWLRVCTRRPTLTTGSSQRGLFHRNKMDYALKIKILYDWKDH